MDNIRKQNICVNVCSLRIVRAGPADGGLGQGLTTLLARNVTHDLGLTSASDFSASCDAVDNCRFLALIYLNHVFYFEKDC
jgi:hypothetical protein